MSVHRSGERTCHGKRRYDSTGLRAKHKLITPLMRCASLAKPGQSKLATTCRLRRRQSEKIAKRGAAWLPVLPFRIWLQMFCFAQRVGIARESALAASWAACAPRVVPVIIASDCAAWWRGDASRGANSCCACDAAARDASSRPWSRCPASVAPLAKPARPAVSPRVKW